MTVGRGAGLVLAVVAMSAWATARGENDEPQRAGVVEHAETRLVQLDVTVTGPPEIITDLTEADFKLKLGNTAIREFSVDRLCRAAEGESDGDEPQPGVVPAPTLGPTTFLFYFDQNHLTMQGRVRAMDVVRDLIPRLIQGGNRGFIVSNAESLETLTNLSSEPEVLVDAVNRLERDRDQWTLFATHEESYVFEILEELRSGNTHRAETLIMLHAADELWRAERDLRRFAMVLGRLARVDPPKAVVYLADNMRDKAGDHYVRLLGNLSRTPLLENRVKQGQYLGAGTSFDRVIDEASSHGTRLYTVQAEGLVPLSSIDVPNSYPGDGRGPAFSAPAGRIKDAQDSLAELALETGGGFFLNGVPSKKIAERILADLSCLYMLSFSPEGLALDAPLAVKLKIKRSGARAQTRGRLVIQSDSARLTSRLLSAFSGPPTQHDDRDRNPDDPQLRLTLIPSGYSDGAYSIIVQLAVPGSELTTATWDMGASVVSRRAVDGTSNRITVAAPGAPVISQRSMAFSPGPFEVVAVAHNAQTDTTISRQLRGEWPEPGAEPASIGPVAVVQPIRGAIQREDDVATWGPVAYDLPELLRNDRPTALVSIVCRGGPKVPFEVERDLVGEAAVSFPPITLEKNDDACAVIRDVIPANTMTPGTFRYDIHVRRDGKELAGTKRVFQVGQP